MGNRLAKPPPLDRPIVPAKPRNLQAPRPFPAITPQSYVPGGVGGGYPVGNIEPPIMNYSGGPGIMQPPMLPSIPPLPPPMPYANQGPISMVRPPSMYDPGYQSYPRRRPVRIHRRPRRSRRCRPVVRIIESSSCSSLSSYTTVSSCSPRRCRSRSHSHRCRGSSSAAPQQPIILLPMQCQQPAAAAAAVAAPAAPAQLPLSVQAQTQAQPQPQQIILPPIRIQQSGQYNQQPFTIPPMTVSQLGGQIQQPQQQSVTLSPMTISQITGQIQQQQPQQAINLAPMRFGSPNILSNTNANSMVIQSGQPFIQPSSSLPQVTTIGQPQQMQGSTIQYVQAAPQSSSSSTLQYISAQPRSTIAPQRVLVNSTNKKQAPSSKPVKRSVSTRELRQSDLKYGRRPFDWYDSNKQDNIINENVQVAQRRNTVMT